MSDKILVLDKVIETIKLCYNPNLNAIEIDTDILLESEGFAIRQGAGFDVDPSLLWTIRNAIKSMKKYSRLSFVICLLDFFAIISILFNSASLISLSIFVSNQDLKSSYLS